MMVRDDYFSIQGRELYLVHSCTLVYIMDWRISRMMLVPEDSGSENDETDILENLQNMIFLFMITVVDVNFITLLI